MAIFPDRGRITAADESYSHQLVAPRLVTENLDETWAERCYHVLYLNEDVILGMGRAVYPYRGERTAFANLRVRDKQYAFRQVEPFVLGDDPDEGRVGGISIEVVEPLREIRLRVDSEEAPFDFDLRFRGRTIGIPTTPNVIERDGRVVTNYMNFYQSGYYSGVIRLGDEQWQVQDRAGFRDRGWGIRKHEGAPRRGFVLFGSLELPDSALYILLYETASGKRVFTNGWVVDDEGIRDTIAGVEHDLELDGTLVVGGTLQLSFVSGRTSELRFEVDNRHFLSTGGYARDGAPVGARSYDLTDPAVIRQIDGQNDNAGPCWLDGVQGYGFIETGIGTHVRYRPES